MNGGWNNIENNVNVPMEANDVGAGQPFFFLTIPGLFLFLRLVGLADTEGDDEKNIPILKEYIKSVGTRLGVTAFLLVFKIDSG